MSLQYGKKKINTVFLNPSPGLSSKGSGRLTFSWLIDLFISGAPNVNFWTISDRKTIWDLEFSEHLW